MFVECVVFGIIIVASVIMGVLIVWEASQKRKSNTRIGELSPEQLQKCGVSNQGISMDENEIYVVPYEQLGFY